MDFIKDNWKNIIGGAVVIFMFFLYNRPPGSEPIFGGTIGGGL